MTPIARALFLLLLPMAAALSGCGPTTGGTGTGDSITLADFGAHPASTCASTIATSLLCVGTGTASDGPGTAAVVFAGSAGSGDYTLQVQGNRAELTSRCNGWQFSGEWGVLASGEARFLGGAASAPGAGVVRAQLVVQQLPGGLQVLLLDADGRTLLGPLLLQRMDAPPVSPPVCP